MMDPSRSSKEVSRDVYFSPSLTLIVSCLILGAGVDDLLTDTRTGSFKYFSAIRAIFGATVAENRRVCRCGAKNVITFSI